MKVGQSRGADWLVVEFFVLLHNSQSGKPLEEVLGLRGGKNHPHAPSVATSNQLVVAG